MFGLWKKKPSRLERFGCKTKGDVLNRIAYMVGYAPDSPPEDEMDLSFAFACVEYGLVRIEELDGRPAIVAVIANVREALQRAQRLFASGEIVPACHALQDAEDLLAPIRVKAVVA